MAKLTCQWGASVIFEKRYDCQGQIFLRYDKFIPLTSGFDGLLKTKSYNKIIPFGFNSL